MRSRNRWGIRRESMVDTVGLFVVVVVSLAVEDPMGVQPRVIQLEGGIRQDFMVLVEVVRETPQSQWFPGLLHMTAVNVDQTTEVDVFGTLTRVMSNIYRMWSEGLLMPTMMESSANKFIDLVINLVQRRPSGAS